MEEKHCRERSLDEQEDLIGSASTHERYLLIEAAFPWDHDILESKDAEAFRYVLDSYENLKPLFIGGDAAYSRKDFRQVILLEKAGMEYAIKEFVIPRGKEALLFPALLEGKAEAYATGEEHRHILICIDGGHDYCCGRWGQPCYNNLRADFIEKDVRVWRCSHIGGHRFAPTAIDFPEGRWYGRLDENAAALFRKERPFEPGMYRGNGCVPREEQAAERDLLIEKGWDAFAN